MPNENEQQNNEKVYLTKDEIAAQWKAAGEEAVNAARQKWDEEQTAKSAKDKEDAERAKAEEQGEYKMLADKADAKRVDAEQKAQAAERRAQLAEVNVQLRDHLAAKHADYLSNAPDIMLHVTSKLAANAKPADVLKLIEDEAKSFVERTPRSKVSPPPNLPPHKQSNTATSSVAKNPNQPLQFTGAAARF